MPISPAMREFYPDNWKEISLAVREESGQRCQSCKLPNGARGYRPALNRDNFVQVPRSDETVLRRYWPTVQIFRIVLTVHHRDTDPSNNDRANLVALCQKCHLDVHRRIRAGELGLS